MSFITRVFNFSLSCAITLSSINFRRMKNVMLSGLLAFVQTTLISADGWGGGEMEYARKNKRDKKRKSHSALLPEMSNDCNKNYTKSS